jgi:hypothetical protein
MSFDDYSGNRRRGQSSQFRNIALKEEMVPMGITDIQIQAKNMVLRFAAPDKGPNGLMILSTYDANDLTKTVKLAESKLAEQVGKSNGLPSNFDAKSFAALLSIALLDDLQAQYTGSLSLHISPACIGLQPSCSNCLYASNTVSLALPHALLAILIFLSAAADIFCV